MLQEVFQPWHSEKNGLRKIEEEPSIETRESSRAHQPPCLRMRQEVRIGIDWSPLDDASSERIQRIVLYDTQNTSRSEHTKGFPSESVAVRETDVVINTNGCHKIKGFRVERKRDR